MALAFGRGKREEAGNKPANNPFKNAQLLTNDEMGNVRGGNGDFKEHLNESANCGRKENAKKKSIICKKKLSDKEKDWIRNKVSYTARELLDFIVEHEKHCHADDLKWLYELASGFWILEEWGALIPTLSKDMQKKAIPIALSNVFLSEHMPEETAAIEAVLGFIDGFEAKQKADILGNVLKVAEKSIWIIAANMVFKLPVKVQKRAYDDIVRTLIRIANAPGDYPESHLEVLEIVKKLPEKRRSRAIEYLAGWGGYEYSGYDAQIFDEMRKIFMAIPDEAKTIGAIVKMAKGECNTKPEKRIEILNHIDKTHDERYIGAFREIIGGLVHYSGSEQNKRMFEIINRMPLEMKIHALKEAAFWSTVIRDTLELTRGVPVEHRLEILPYFIKNPDFLPDSDGLRLFLGEVHAIPSEKRVHLLEMLISKKYLMNIGKKDIFFIVEMAYESRPEIRDKLLGRLKDILLLILDNNAAFEAFDSGFCYDGKFWDVVERLPEQMQKEINRYHEEKLKRIEEFRKKDSASGTSSSRDDSGRDIDNSNRWTRVQNDAMNREAGGGRPTGIFPK